MTSTLKRTPLHDQHLQLGARMVDFAGWSMPLLYRGINDEHRHTREKCSLFDVSHMGRIELHGDDAVPLLDRICTRRLADMTPGQCRYSHICDDRGGILDDVIVSRCEDRWLVICNASNRAKVLAWLREHAAGRPVRIEDITESTAMIAVQGPQTMALAARRIPLPLADLGRYRLRTGEYFGMRYTVCRTGYTGEDGFEVILPAQAAVMAWQFLLQPEDEYEPAVAQPAGLGARDTLRLEAGMPLYGHELHEGADPIRAGFAWCVDLTKDFIGAEALRHVAASELSPRLVGLDLEGKRIARQGFPVVANGRTIGEVTSGTLSSTLDRSIAMAYVDADFAVPGTRVAVRIRDQEHDATVVKLPFLRKASGGS